jgi:hypothetical protein
VEMNGRDVALLLGVYGTFALDVFSTLNSSPQTTELFAGDREDTLMHWVLIGDAAALGGGIAASYVTGNVWPLIATGGIVVMMHVLYKHAVHRGQGQARPERAQGY